ncbi:hypothetical protein KMZ68_02625 [Bradyrhizobium sediminis]|uniref:Uncharacterized protein n=1 Tax=Bradyrhizobium sediminis TaxID=2840469 RepID=A0A975NQE3_9BRAD|nr:hypothetical protein [Bradyrhizobium sediminis]QWG18806.1 hypothetical protein KMZ68_02625 [Bradyrhizobium sediminis]
MDRLRPFRPIDYLNQRELKVLRRVAASGSELAPAAALHFCATYKADVPEWLTGLAARGYCEHLNSNRPKKRGRSSGPIERYRQDMIDYMRWDTVRSTRDKQKDCPESLAILETNSNRCPYIKDYNKLLRWYGHDWLRAYECASMFLRGTPAFGGPDAMKASYCRVEHASNPLRYFLFQPEFLESVGLEHPSRWGWSTKCTPLYNLTL